HRERRRTRHGRLRDRLPRGDPLLLVRLRLRDCELAQAHQRPWRADRVPPARRRGARRAPPRGGALPALPRPRLRREPGEAADLPGFRLPPAPSAPAKGNEGRLAPPAVSPRKHTAPSHGTRPRAIMPDWRGVRVVYGAALEKR